MAEAGDATGHEAALTRTAQLARVIDGIRANQHAKVLIVGCRGDNFPEPWRSHSQLVFWEGGDAATKDVPQAVRLILLTRFLSHHGYGRLNRISSQRNIVFGVETMGTGQIKDLLRPLIADVKPQAEPAPIKKETIVEQQPVNPPATPPAASKRAQADFPSGMLEFIRAHGDPFKEPHNREAQRLEALARSMGIATTSKSLENGMYRLRNAIGSAAKAKPAVATAIAPPPVATFPPVAAPQPATAVADDDVELLRMLDDAAKAITDLGAAVGLIRETVKQRADSRKQLKALLSKL